MVNAHSKEFVILIVDDRPENIVSLEEILAQDGRRFLHASSGNEALKQVLKNEHIGLILLDVQMPEMDGFEVAHLLKANSRTKDIAIIFVTAISKEERYVLKGFEEGAVDYLYKPLDVNITRAKVNVFQRLYVAQQQLSESLEEVARINRQLEKFVFIVSHDLKSPLASITMLTDLLLADDRIASQEELRENVGIIAHASAKLAGMIQAILEYSRQSFEQQAVEEVDSAQLVSGIVEMLVLPAHFTVDISPGMPLLSTRKIKLQQVFQNLISNAVKYHNKPSARLEIGATEKGNWYEFFVKDDGPGILPRDHDRIFQVFETTGNKSSKDSSTGVGLNLLKMLVEEQGGAIRVDSVPGEGSTFYFTWKKS